MKAVIMAGGFGTRLRPLTCNVPKPMVPLVNRPMMQHIVDLLKQHGITDLAATLFYQPDVISSFFGDGAAFGVRMQYCRSDADFGTAGSVRNARDFLTERFIVISGDVLTDFDLTSALRFHEEKKSVATVLLTRVQNPLQYGIVLVNAEGRITRFLEKPSWGEVFSDTINTGIYILEPELLDLIPTGEEFDFSKNLFPLLLEKNLGLHGYIADGYWRDIGNLNEYQDSHIDVLRNLVNLQVDGNREKNLILGEGCELETDRRHLSGMIIVGKNTVIRPGAVISNSVIGDDCVIKENAVIRNSVIWSGTEVGMGSEILSSVLGYQCILGDHVNIAENVFVGDRCILGRRSQLYSNIKLWPNKVVEDGATVTRSLIWEDRWMRELFTNSRISGLSNVEMNAEFGAKLGAAFGALVGPGASIVTSRDSDNVSRMMNRALICGLMSAGVHCRDLRATSIPIVRHELRGGKDRGGIHVRKSPFDKNFTDIIFFDANGKDLSTNRTKAVERMFFGEDFARASHDNVGIITFPERTTESYIERFLGTINIPVIRNAGLKLVIDYSNGVASTIFPNVLGGLNVQVVSLNAYLEKRRLTRSKEEFDQSFKELSFVVTSLKYDVGAMLDAGAEKLFAVDEDGTVISSDRLMTLMTRLMILAHPSIRRIAVPISATAEIDLLAKEHGLTIVKTRDSHLALMDAASSKEIDFVAGTKGGFIFKDFLFASDSMYSVVKLLECMAITNRHLGDLDRETSRLHFVKKNVPCSWHIKGRIMRRLLKDTESDRRDLIEGIKVYPKNASQYTSVYLRPDPARPVFHVNAESEDRHLAETLLDNYLERIVNWIESEK